MTRSVTNVLEATGTPASSFAQSLGRIQMKIVSVRIERASRGVHASAIGALAVLLGLFLFSSAARADEILVGNVTPTNTIGAYDTSGATVNSSLISLPSPGSPESIAVSGSNVFVASQCCFNPGSIGEYTTAGGAVNTSLVTGLNSPGLAIAVSGSALFVALTATGTIAEYNTSGAL